MSMMMDYMPEFATSTSQKIDNSPQPENEVEEGAIVESRDDEGMSAPKEAVYGTILESAFVDQAYPWPPPVDEADSDDDTLNLTDDGSDNSIEEPEEKPEGPTKKTTTKKPAKTKSSKFACCRSNEAVVEMPEQEPKEEKPEAVVKKQKAVGKVMKKIENKEYDKAPEGLLIYRLNTSTHKIELISSPPPKTNYETLLREMDVARSWPSNDPSRRGIELIGVDGSRATIYACDQRTAMVWTEAIDMMLAHGGRKIEASGITEPESRMWGAEKLNTDERDKIEAEYFNMVRAGDIPGTSSQKRVSGGIYVATGTKLETDEAPTEESLESVAKRRAVVKDSWDYYRMLCSLVRDRRRYDDAFRTVKLDPVYPYFDSLTGLNDNGQGDIGKTVTQPQLPEYEGLSDKELADALVQKAEETKPVLLEVCKRFAGKLGLKEVGLGPVKKADIAIKKAESRYSGDILKVTDYCRALVVVKDMSAVLALLELAREEFGDSIQRLKLTPLKADHKGMTGGYRDIKVNIDINDHICEIQVHIWSLWTICGVDGYRHYKHAKEYNIDSFKDPFRTLDGLDRKSVAELIVQGEETVTDAPLDNLEYHQEKFILDYYAEVGLLMKNGNYGWAEITLKKLIELRMESPDYGHEHIETLTLNKYLKETLEAQDKMDEVYGVQKVIEETENARNDGADAEADAGIFGACGCDFENMCGGLLDPNGEDREVESEQKRSMKKAKKKWRKIRKERYPFLESGTGDVEEDEAAVAEVATFETYDHTDE